MEQTYVSEKVLKFNEVNCACIAQTEEGFNVEFQGEKPIAYTREELQQAKRECGHEDNYYMLLLALL